VFKAQHLFRKRLRGFSRCDTDTGLAKDWPAIQLGGGLVDGATGLRITGL